MTNFILADVATTTLAATASPSSTTLTLSSATNWPASIPSGFVLPVILNDAATRQVYEICYATAISGTSLTVTRGQEGFSAQSWNIGDYAYVAMTAAAYAAVVPSRTALTAATTFYVNASTGSDSTGNGSSGNPWATLQHAWNVLQNSYDLGGYAVTIQATGALSNLSAAGLLLGQGTNPVTINFASGSTMQANTANSVSIASSLSANLSISGSCTFTGSGSNASALTASSGGVLSYQGVTFGSFPSGNHVSTVGDGSIFAVGNYTISSGAQSHWLADSAGGNIGVNSAITITLSGTPPMATFATVTGPSIISAPNSLVTFSGSATGIRYNANNNGVIVTFGGGANFFPGNSAGTTASGGQYS